MQVILTPNAVADLFGPGLNGFTGSVPGPATELSPEWFNSMQMETVNVIIGQGIALDGLQFDQLKQAIDNYTFVDPKISGSLIIQNGAALIVKSGGQLQCDPGSSVTFSTFSTSGPVVIGGSLSVGTTLGTSGLATLQSLSVTTTAVIGGVLTASAGINLGAQQIQGSAGSIVDVDRALVDKIEFTDMGSTYSTTPGHLRWNTTALMFSQGVVGDAVAIDDPQRGFDLAFSTVNAIDTTTAVASRQAQENEPLWIETTCRFEGTSAASNMNYRLQIAGPATIDVDIQTFTIQATNVGYSMVHVFLWTPTDDFIAPGTRGYNFTVRLGRSAGTLTCANVSIKVSSALEI